LFLLRNFFRFTACLRDSNTTYKHKLPGAARLQPETEVNTISIMKNKYFQTAYLKYRKNWPVIVLFITCMAFTSIAWIMNKQAMRQAVLDHATKDAIDYQRAFRQGINAYVDLSRNLAGLFAANDQVTRQAFDHYLQTANPLERPPGLSYVGYVPRIPSMNREVFAASALRDNPAYALHGESGRDTDYFYPYLYGYPHDKRVKLSEGLDFSGFPARWTAMQQARDTGHSIVTAKHAYLHDPIASAIIMVFTPVYDLKLPISTVEQRRIALRGFVFATFMMEEVVERIMGPTFKNLFDLEIYEEMVGHQSVLYDGDKKPHVLIGDQALPIAHQEKIVIANKDWHLFFYPKPIYFDSYGSSHGGLILLFGLVIAAALSFLMWKWLRLQWLRTARIEQGHRFEAIFENHPSAVYSLDLQRRFLNANAKALSEFKISKASLVGISVDRLIVPENLNRMNEFFNDVLQGNSVSYDSAIINAAGTRLEMSVIMIPVTVDGTITSVLGVAQNVTERKFAEWQLEASRNMLQLVINHIPQRVFWKNTELVYLGCNDAFCKDAGLDHPEQIIGKTDFELAWRADAELYRQGDFGVINSGASIINFEEPQHRGGDTNWLRTSKIPISDMNGKTVAVLGVYEDITERKALEQKLQSMAHYDSLTGLANRAFFYSHVDQAVLRSRRDESSFLALMYLDLDKFKSINDTYGHAVGDALLKAFSARIKRTVRAIDMVSRLGGDEFALLLEDLPDQQAATAIAEKIIGEMQAVFQIHHNALQVSTSIGIALLETRMTAAELIDKADAAMYQAKKAGRNRCQMADQP
jgi:diguanylate cyclase (GGDEF)-like protein/PAS domain S-box-containing protein